MNIITKAAYEFQAAAKGAGANYSLETGLKTELVFPRLISPIPLGNHYFRYNIPKTITSVEEFYAPFQALHRIVGHSKIWIFMASQ